MTIGLVRYAPTPLPIPASARGNAPNVEAALGIAVPDTARIGALSMTPAAIPEKNTTNHWTRRPTAGPNSRSTVPSASHGTVSTAPRRKKTR